MHVYMKEVNHYIDITHSCMALSLSVVYIFSVTWNATENMVFCASCDLCDCFNELKNITSI